MRVYWHNLTRGWFNESELDEFIEIYDPGDVIMFSIAGNALIYSLTNRNDDEDREFDYVRREFLDTYQRETGRALIIAGLDISA
jgi:hypothetical protein